MPKVSKMMKKGKNAEGPNSHKRKKGKKSKRK